MARYKFNTFHWHLTEDQGWRLEIKRYPRLTQIGAFRKETVVGRNVDPYIGDSKLYGGFYTQKQVRELIANAAQRHITIVPEIDLPGHTIAALAAYPELACTPGPFAVSTTWSVDENILCPSEDTFRFTVKPSRLQPGLARSYFEADPAQSEQLAEKAPAYFAGEATKTGELAGLSPVRRDVASGFDFPYYARREWFGLSYQGWLRIPEADLYRFHLSSRDLSTLKVDEPIIAFDDSLSPVDKDGLIGLAGGLASPRAALLSRHRRARAAIVPGPWRCVAADGARGLVVSLEK
jgi:hypothetical protein